VRGYNRMKSTQNGKLKIDSEWGKKVEIELPWSRGGIGWGGGGSRGHSEEKGQG